MAPGADGVPAADSEPHLDESNSPRTKLDVSDTSNGPADSSPVDRLMDPEKNHDGLTSDHFYVFVDKLLKLWKTGGGWNHRTEGGDERELLLTVQPDTTHTVPITARLDQAGLNQSWFSCDGLQNVFSGSGDDSRCYKAAVVFLAFMSLIELSKH